MRNLIKTILVLVFIHAIAIQAQDTLTPLHRYLQSIPEAEIEKLPSSPPFDEKYVLMVPQFVDHADPEQGMFRQRVYILHRHPAAPVVLTTEGYNGGYASRPYYQNELDAYLGANEIVVEHRYFGPSTPDPLNWKYLTVENAATDHHRIVELLKPYFTGKWVNTGISKGGQTALYHRAYFPDDVDATVGYVCPLNFSIEERRCYEFLDEVGTEDCRNRIHDFQSMLLCNRDKYFPAFRDLADSLGLTFSLGYEAGYELTVLEYSFAFWQWGNTPCAAIPGEGADPDSAMAHLNAVAGLDWMSVEGVERMQPFFYQALTEIGFYGYDHGEFPGCVNALSSQTLDFTCPQGVDCVYDPRPMEKVDNFVRHHGENMIFIYGEWDPWSAPAVQITGKTNNFKVVNPQGSHGTRIRNLPEEQRDKVLNALGEWLDCEIYR